MSNGPRLISDYFIFLFVNRMIILWFQAWLERAENAAKAKKEADGYNGQEKKRKRTSIAAPEKRSLEAYFTVQPRLVASSRVVLTP